MTTADDIAQAIADARPVFEDAVLADAYELLIEVKVDDPFGGTTSTEQIVESGRCLLDVVGARSEETQGTFVAAIGPYVVDLPVDTIATASHRIRITSPLIGETREFAIVGPPKRGGDFAVFTRLELEMSNRA